MFFSFMRLFCCIINAIVLYVQITDSILPLYQPYKCLLSALGSVKNRFYCNACFCIGAITCLFIHNLNPFYFL